MLISVPGNSFSFDVLAFLRGSFTWKVQYNSDMCMEVRGFFAIFQNMNFHPEPSEKQLCWSSLSEWSIDSWGWSFSRRHGICLWFLRQLPRDSYHVSWRIIHLFNALVRAFRVILLIEGNTWISYCMHTWCWNCDVEFTLFKLWK